MHKSIGLEQVQGLNVIIRFFKIHVKISGAVFMENSTLASFKKKCRTEKKEMSNFEIYTKKNLSVFFAC